MPQATAGIHHVTAIASDPQRNVDFYAGTLGLRLVKVTVNYDDPGSYHFYYGDASGAPGSIVTFFAWPRGRRGRRGASQTRLASLAVPPGSLPYWRRRLTSEDVELLSPAAVGAQEAGVVFEDPDGLLLQLVEDAAAATYPAWSGSDVPGDTAVRGLHGVTLSVPALQPTEETLIDALGFRLVEKSGAHARYAVAGSGRASLVDVVESTESHGNIAVGNIHHVAWRAPDAAAQEAWLTLLREQGYGVSPVMDRQYFQSIYFQEPGGIIFEIATDPPGFTADEPLDALGTGLRLPNWLESRRPEIELALPPIVSPAAGRGETANAGRI